LQLLDEITDQNGQNQNIARIAEGLSISPEQSEAVIREVMPEISHYLERNTLSRGGLADLMRSLGDSNRENYLKAETDLAAPSAIDEGNRLLGQILQTKYRSRALADRTEARTGVPAAKIRQMLPRIANVSMAALKQQSRPALDNLFKKLPSFSDKRAGQQRNAGASPLPLPGDDWGGQSRNGYDDLSDMLTRRQGPLQSNPLWHVARQVIGSLLGFKSKGIIGYVIRFLVIRYGWSILRMVFGRMFRA
jgi:Bacterial protein of unknown function (DUF937)